MKPFLILQLRPDDAVSQNEFEAFLKYGGLQEDQVHRVRMDQGDLPNIDLDNYSAVIIGGGPSNISDKESEKPDYQKKFETWLEPIVKEIIDRDFPCLGACYGLGAMTNFGGGKMGKGEYAEDLAVVNIHVLPIGQMDPLLQGLDNPFKAIVGHKESCHKLPEGAVLFAESEICSNHMFRMGRNVYGTQFHPELDSQGALVRADAYQYKGYFPADKLHEIKEYFSDKDISVPMMILSRFVDRYR